MLLGATTITRRRYSAGSRATTGYWTEGATTDTSITASVQPASGEDLQVLPEGERTRRAIKVYTTTELRTTSPQDGTRSDELVIAGLVGIDDGTYQVESVAPYYALLGHHKAIAVRAQEAA